MVPKKTYLFTGTFKGCKKPLVLGNNTIFNINKATGSNRIKSIIVCRF